MAREKKQGRAPPGGSDAIVAAKRGILMEGLAGWLDGRGEVGL
jgi:hypothetical protein